jgi:hypothetical protein
MIEDLEAMERSLPMRWVQSGLSGQSSWIILISERSHQACRIEKANGWGEIVLTRKIRTTKLCSGHPFWMSVWVTLHATVYVTASWRLRIQVKDFQVEGSDCQGLSHSPQHGPLFLFLLLSRLPSLSFPISSRDVP